MAIIKKYWRWIIVVLLLIATLIVWQRVCNFHQGKLLVAFLNVGQGDAIFIEAPNGHQVLIDGGPDDSVLRELGKLMPVTDRSIDLVILTHPHADHLDGLISVLQRYQVEAVLESQVEYPGSADYKEWRQVVEGKEINDIRAFQGERIDLGAGVVLSILAPLVDWRGQAPKNVHEAMVVARLDYASTSVMLTGDMEKLLESQLLADGDNLDSDILKVGHHGSKTSSSEQFLEAVTPQEAIISVGAKNRYGLPYPGTLTELGQEKIPILRTDELGTLIFESDGRSFTWRH